MIPIDVYRPRTYAGHTPGAPIALLDPLRPWKAARVMAPPNAGRSARLSMRISAEALETIRDAAAAQQQDVTSFVLGAALDRARTVLVDDSVMRLSRTEAARLEAGLDAEPRVIPELAALIREVRGSRLSVDADLAVTSQEKPAHALR